MIHKDLDSGTREDLERYFEDRDYMVIAVPKKEPARVYTLRASRAVETAQKIHGEDWEVIRELGKVMVGALLLSSLVKHASDQKVLLKVSGIVEGKTLIAEADGKGRVRAMISEGDEKEPTLTVIKELGMGTPYTSILPIVSKELDRNLSYYFRQSEQIPSAVSVDVVREKNSNRILAGGFLIQTLGGISKSVLELLEERSLTIPRPGEFLREGKRPEDMAIKILKDLEPTLIGLKEVEYYCPCSEDVARSSLLLLSEEEIRELTSDGPAEVTCNFCGRVYRFSGEDIINSR
jgi:molecular chaperone Hsp33